MDLLASLHLEELPEQQTRIAHLGDTLANDSNISLGFNACCTCASRPKLEVECRACHRVRYCSEECLKKDASLANQDETASGHSSVICALLGLCRADEDTEFGKSDNEAGIQRVQSEYESYPATLSNILLDAPCFQDSLSNVARRETKELMIHVIGAAQDVELWGGKRHDVWEAYAEALSSVAERHRLKVIHVGFVGPECPSTNLQEQRTYDELEKDIYSYKFIAETRRCKYAKGTKELASIKKADIVVFFNPGFTCLDYEWDSALLSISKETPFLVTTNTEMEAIADCQYLLDKGYISGLPPIVAGVMGGGNNEDADTADIVPVDDNMFFGENPYAGSRVRQSGTMANDLYVKNRWIFGGVLGTSSAGRKPQKVSEESPKKRKREKSANTKRKNPALI